MNNQNTPRPASGGVGPSAQGASHPSAALTEGAIFAGRYRIVRCMAAGGMGSVYEVVHTETDRRRALKVMHPHLFQSEEMRDRFKREARIAAQLRSEHIVDVADAGVDEATKAPFLVMELLEGEELGDRLKRVGALPPAEVVDYVHQTALALDKTHAKSIVHRDLKPENLFLTMRENGTPLVKILDFGVAKVVAEGATGAGATKSLGTPLYMAPEQFRVGNKLLPSVDIYALGMTAYTLLAGEPYWGPEARASGDVIAFAMAAIRGPVESAVKRAAARGVVLPPGFDAWFSRATAVNAAQRFATASELAAALGAVFHIAAGAAVVASQHPMHPMSAALGAQAMPAAGTPGLPTPPRAMTPVAPLTQAAPMVAGPTAWGAPGAGSGALDPRSSGSTVALPPAAVPGSTEGGMFARAASSTGATFAPAQPAPPERSRAPLVAVGAVGVVILLGAGAWFGMRSVAGGAAAASPLPASAAAAPSAAASQVVAPPSAEAPVASVTPSSTTAPPAATATSTAAASAAAGNPAPRPSATGAKAAAPPTKTPASKPSAAPATGTQLIGRD